MIQKMSPHSRILIHPDPRRFTFNLSKATTCDPAKSLLESNMIDLLQAKNWQPYKSISIHVPLQHFGVILQVKQAVLTHLGSKGQICSSSKPRNFFLLSSWPYNLENPHLLLVINFLPTSIQSLFQNLRTMLKSCFVTRKCHKILSISNEDAKEICTLFLQLAVYHNPLVK